MDAPVPHAPRAVAIEDLGLTPQQVSVLHRNGYRLVEELAVHIPDYYLTLYGLGRKAVVAMTPAIEAWQPLGHDRACVLLARVRYRKTLAEYNEALGALMRATDEMVALGQAVRPPAEAPSEPLDLPWER